MIALEIRHTHRYRSGWSHLDEQEHVGSAEVERVKLHDDGESGGELFIVTVIPDGGRTEDDINKALRDSLSGSNCQHEHDCCGCLHRYVTSTRKLGENRYAVRSRFYHNI